MDEVVDIVDESLQIIKPVSKKRAHKKGLLHPCIIAEIINSKGEWILVKQNSHKQDAGQYVSPVGGHVQSGESELDALKREALEETGLSEFTYERIGAFIYERKVIGRHENHYFIVYKIFSDTLLKLNEESVEYRAFSETVLKKLLKENPKQFGDAFLIIVKTLYPELLSIID